MAKPLMSFKYAVPAEFLVEIQAKLEHFMREGGVEFTNLGAWPYDPEAATKPKFVTRKAAPTAAPPPSGWNGIGATDARVLELLTKFNRPTSTKEIEAALGMTAGQASSAIHRLQVLGRITRTMRGVYTVAK